MYGEVFDFGEVAQIIDVEAYENGGNFRNHANISNQMFDRFASTLQLCTEDLQDFFVNYIPKNIEPNIAQVLADLAIPKHEIAAACHWNGHFSLCDKIFRLALTTEGICYQFNGLRTKDIYRDKRYVSYSDSDEFKPKNNITGTWSLKDGFVDQGYNSYPKRSAFSSVRNALKVFLHGYEHNIELNCRNFTQGYRIYLNSPESVQSTSGNFVLLPHNHEIIIKVIPQYIIAAKSLANFPPEKRQCYFEDERFLQFFRYYSESNCKVECLANYTISKCGCAKFWMPKPLNVRTCNHLDIRCSREAQEDLDMLVENSQTQQTTSSSKFMCDCMPACTSLEYDLEISAAKYNLNGTLTAFRQQDVYSDYLGSRLIVTFKEHQFTAVKRTVLFSMTTFIANCGGIFALFMGSSLLSAIELIYFFSVRLLINLRNRHSSIRKIKAMDKTLEDHHN